MCAGFLKNTPNLSLANVYFELCDTLVWRDFVLFYGQAELGLAVLKSTKLLFAVVRNDFSGHSSFRRKLPGLAAMSFRRSNTPSGGILFFLR